MRRAASWPLRKSKSDGTPQGDASVIAYKDMQTAVNFTPPMWTDAMNTYLNQEIAKATGTAKLIVACCPAHVYTEEPDGTISVEYAACLECGTCLAIAAPGALKWHYPRGGFGVQFREG